MKQGAASNMESGTAIYRHREWRGLRDTAYDFTKWAQLWVILIRWALAHPAQNVKAVLRYRWMFSYLCVPSFLTGSAPDSAALACGRRGSTSITWQRMLPTR